MLQKINHYLLEIFSNSDINKLLAALAFVSLFIWFFFEEIALLLGGVMIAYVLEGGVQQITHKLRIKRTIATLMVVIIAVCITLVVLSTLPNLLFQLRELGSKLPESATLLENFYDRVNKYLPAELAMDKDKLTAQLSGAISAIVNYLLGNTLNLASNLFSLFVYMVLLPLLVFFMLKDKEVILGYVESFFPPTTIWRQLWIRVNEQFGSYIRGKFIEALIIGSVSWWVFLWFRMDYNFALAAMVGLSVFVPFVGAVAVTFPVLLFGYIQFGWSSDFAWIIGWYTLIQVLDGQVIVPLLFSQVVKIHPVAIFTAIIFFGNLWGFWGVFFAIPLASLIKSLVTTISEYWHRKKPSH